MRKKNPPVTASPCRPPLGKGAWGRGMRIATGALRPRNDRGFTRGQCKAGRRDTWVPPYGGVTRGAVGRADVGSELSAASGRSSEVSEWPRSKFPASAVRQRRNFGHRNRVIGPYERSQEVQWLLGGAMWWGAAPTDVLQGVRGKWRIYRGVAGGGATGRKLLT